MTDAAAGRWIGFRLGGTGAALPLDLVREVTDRPPVVRVPGSRPFVAGVSLYARVALPVYDLRRFAGLWSTPSGDAEPVDAAEADHLIVCDWGEARLGLLGGRVDIVPAADEDAGEEAGPCRLKTDYVRRVLRVRGEEIALLDADALFASLGVPRADPRGRREAGEDDPAGG